jgi:transcription antitermination factor NusG
VPRVKIGQCTFLETIRLTADPDMPLLDAEISQHPADLLASAVKDETPGREGIDWWAAQTRSRQEKKLMRTLLERDVAFYCPIAARHYRSPAGRARTSYLPLFGNYVFVAGDERARAQVLASGCVAQCLRATEPERLVRQLHVIATAIAAGAALQPESRIPVGTPVRVRSGAFAGVEGVVAERRGQMRLYLNVDFIQRGASLAVYDWEVERL